MNKINDFINRYFGMLLLISAIAGLFIKIPVKDISKIIIVALGAIIFSSFFKVSLDKQLFREDTKNAFIYLIVRFVVLPVIVYYLFSFFSPFYSVIFFLLMILPAAVSSPAFTLMYGGKVSLALKILVLTSFLSILTIPVLSNLLLSKKIELDAFHMFLTMVYTIVIPFFLHIPFRNNKKISSFFTSNNPIITAAGLIIIFIVATSSNREIILSDPQKVVIYLFISLITYIILYMIGYFLVIRQKKENSIAYSVASGANNIGIGVTITALYFVGDINVFMIVAQLTWIFTLIPMRFFFKKIS